MLRLEAAGRKGYSISALLKALVENDIPIDYLAGSSVGAWVSGHYALNRNIAQLEELTNRQKNGKIIQHA